jgi:hypothetical protein
VFGLRRFGVRLRPEYARAAGVVEATPQGATLLYRLADERVGELLQLARAIIAKRLQTTSDLLADLGG